MKTCEEYCVSHGSQTFFLGEVMDENMDYLGEALHCPLCYPEHEDNPAVIAKTEAQAYEECRNIMAL